jgi:hypothetical protein
MRMECVLCQVLTEILYYYLGVFKASKVNEVELKIFYNNWFQGDDSFLRD